MPEARIPVLVIGSGSYLSRALRILVTEGFSPVIHSTKTEDGVLPLSLRASSKGDPNSRFLTGYPVSIETPVICVNNPFILDREFLLRHINVYNIHNSDVTQNRGLAQFCTIDTMLNGSLSSGVSLQKIAPGADVDANPTLLIEKFRIPAEFGFEDIMLGLKASWLRSFSRFLIPHLRGESILPELSIPFGPVVTAASVRDRVFNLDAFDPRLMELGLGNFTRFFPKASSMVNDFQDHWRKVR